MRNRLQYTEEPSLYYKRLWDIPEASLKDLIMIYELNKDIWRYKSFNKWFKECYKVEITYSKFRGFKRYLKYYNKRKKLHLSKNVKVGKQFFD